MSCGEIVGQDEFTGLHVLQWFVYRHDLFCFILAKNPDLPFCVVNLRNEIDANLACQLHGIAELVSIFVVGKFALILSASDCNARAFIALLSKIRLKDACGGLDVLTGDLCILRECGTPLCRRFSKRLLTLIEVKEHHWVG